MVKTLTLAAALLGLCSLSAPAQGIREGGCIRVSKVKGKLVKKEIPLRCLAPYVDGPSKPRDIHIQPAERTVWLLEAGGKTYTLEAKWSRTLWRRANGLVGKEVVVTGVVTGKSITVQDIQPAA
jgi:hypothetical protein